MKNSDVYVCRFCHRQFVPDPRNKHHQKCCPRPVCRRALAAERQRKRRRKLKENQEEYQAYLEKDRERKRKSRAGAQKGRASTPRPPPFTGFDHLNFILTGMVAHFADTQNRDDISCYMNRMLETGRNFVRGS